MARKNTKVITSADAAKPAPPPSNKMSNEDKGLCRSVATYGIDYLRLEKGWTDDGIEQFMARADVRREITHLEQNFTGRDSTQAKAAFFRLNFVHTLVPDALRVVAMVMKGDILKDDGSVERAPSRLQYEAATQILDRANIQGAKLGNATGASVLDSSATGVNRNIQAVTPARREALRRVMSGVNRKANAIVAAEEAGRGRRRVLAEVDEAGEPVEPEGA